MLLPPWLDPEYLIQAAGPYALPVVAFIIFAECGLFAILAGRLAAVHRRAVRGAGRDPLRACPSSAWCSRWPPSPGNVSGYWIGRLIGPPLFRPRRGLAGRILNPKYVTKTHAFCRRVYGNRALILARFVPIVRTFVTLVAGVGEIGLPQVHRVQRTSAGCSGPAG